MAQQVQFVYLAQSEYDTLESKSPGQLYFTSDTHRIYRGTELYATTSFDQVSAQTATFGDLTVTGNVSMSLSQVEFGRIEASEITVDGSQVSLEGHTHPELSGITESDISKTSATFQDLTVTGDVTFSVDQLDFQSLTASSLLVNGSSVALEGHVHSASDISDFSDAVVSAGTSVFASASHSHDGLQGLTSSSISKDFASFNSISASTATFDNLVVNGDVSLSLSKVQFGSITASEISVNGSQVSLEGHVHGMSEVEGLSELGSSISAMATFLSGITESSISKTSATFQDLVVTGDVTFSLEGLDFQSLTASSIVVDGKSVSLEGHTHSFADVDGLSSHVSQVTASVSAFGEQLQGITSSGIAKSTATFGDLTITGELTFSLDQVQFGSIVASDISVNGSSVALEGHTHSMSEISGLESLATTLSGITESTIVKTSATFQDLVVTGAVTFSVDQLDFDTLTASTILLNGSSIAVEGHLHSISDVFGLESAVSAAAAYESRIAYLEGIVSALSTTYVTRSEFVTLSASIESILDDIISGQAAAESQINQI